jgi:pyruvate formate lyase activating enzyme
MRIGGFEKTTLIDYPGKVAAMIYTIGCNFRCPYCHNPELVDETADELNGDAILEFLKERRKLLDGLVITGGEPTMHEDLPLFMKKVKDLDLLIKLDSNGTNPEMLKKLYAEGLIDYLAMDIKGPLEKYSEQVARPVHIDAIKESIGIIMKSGVEYEFRTTIVKSLLSADDLESMAKSIQGASRYYLQKFIPNKILNPQLRRKVAYTNEEYEELRQKVSPYVNFCAIR